MRKIIGIFLLVAVLIQSSSDLCIIVSFYLQRNYIAENLCINRFEAIPVCKGQCFLDEKLKQNEEKEKKYPDLRQKDIHLFFQNNFSFEFDKPFTQYEVHGLIQLQKLLPTEFAFSVFHPPKTA